MSRDELTSTSYRVLVLVGRGGAGPHDLVRMVRVGRVYQAAAESAYYAEPKRLEKLGYLRSRKEPGKTRQRTHYEITEKGIDALREWMRKPASPPRVATDAIERVLAGDLVGDEAVLSSLAGMRDEIHSMLEGVSTSVEAAERLPHRRTYLLLNYRLARAVLEAHLAWLDDVERELSPRSSP